MGAGDVARARSNGRNAMSSPRATESEWTSSSRMPIASPCCRFVAVLVVGSTSTSGPHHRNHHKPSDRSYSFPKLDSQPTWPRLAFVPPRTSALDLLAAVVGCDDGSELWRARTCTYFLHS
eukprot:COSAG02_NODE_3536_length_6594_cov_4.786605_5_plen_121_part_00